MRYQIELLEIGGIAILTLYNFILFSRLKKRYYLYLSVLCFAIFLRATLAYDESSIFYVFFPKLYLLLGKKLEYFFSYATVPLALLFIHSLYNFKNFRKYIDGFFILTGVFLLFVLVTPFSVYSHTRDTYIIIIVIAYAFKFVMISKAIRLNLTGSTYVLVGSIPCFLFLITELLKISGVIFVDNSLNFVNSGFLIFLLFQSLASSKIFAESIEKNLEKRVEEKTSQLSKSNLFYKTLIRIMSHDMRNPLSNLKSIATLFQNEQIGIEKVKELMHSVNSGIDCSIQMLDDLTEWGQTSHSQEDEEVEIKIENILSATVNQMIYEIEKKELSVSITGDIGGVCLFDENAIKIVVRNLLSNSVKFTEKGGVINIEIFDGKEYIELNFKDTGIGIPESMKKNMFQLKKANNRPGTDNERGCGIGLFICKNLVQQNGGSIYVMDNPEGKGSIFKLELKKAFQEIII